MASSDALLRTSSAVRAALESWEAVSSAVRLRAFSSASATIFSAAALASATTCSASALVASASLVASLTSRATCSLAVRVRCSFADSALESALAAASFASARTFSASARASRSAVSASLMRCSAARLSSVRLAARAVRLGRGRTAQLLGVVGGLLGLRRRRVQQPLGVRAGPAQQRLGLGARLLGVALQPLTGLGGDPLGLRAGGGQGLLGLGTGLVEEPAGLLLAAGAQLLGPRHVLVDVRLDALPALGQLLVELLAAGDRLLVQLRLETGGLLGVLLEDPLGLRAGLAQLPLGVLAQLVGLDLRVTEHLLGLVADVGAVVGRPGRQTAARLVQLGAQHLDLIAEVLGVLDGLLPLGLQPLHLGLEPREVVDVSRRLSLLAFVAPHCAVPSVPWSQVSPNEHRPSAERGPRGMVSDQRRSTRCCPAARPPKPGPRPSDPDDEDPDHPEEAAAVPNPTGPYVRGSVLR